MAPPGYESHHPEEAAVPAAAPTLPIPQANAGMQATFSNGSSASTSKGAGKGAQRASMLQAKAKAQAALQAAAQKAVAGQNDGSPGMASVASEAIALARGEIVQARAKPMTREQQQKLEAGDNGVRATATARTFTAEEYEVLSDMGQAPTSPENSMRNVRIEGADSQAKWFVEEGVDEWKPFTRLDQRSLERAWSNPPEERPRSVPVQGGRAEVILGERLLKERYGLVPPQPLRGVRRSLWLRKEHGSQVWEPFEESQDALLEAGYQELLATMQAMVQNAEDPSCIDDNVSAAKAVNLPGEKQVHLKLRVAYKRDSKQFRWELAAEERSSRWWEKTTSILKAKFTSVRRGLKPSEVLWQPGEAEEEAFVTKPIERLYFMVHGGLRGEESLGRGRAGSGTWDRARQLLKWCRDQASQGFEGHGLLAQSFRRHIRKCQLTWAGLRQLRRSGRGVLDPNGEGPWTMPDPSRLASISHSSSMATTATTAAIGGVVGPTGNSRLRRDEVIEVSWAISQPHIDPLEKLACVSLPDAREAQMVASSAFASALLFVGGAMREAALSSVASAVEAGYELFKASNQDFEGSIKLVGHGVEGALLFELIRLKRLSFNPTALFLVGSPLGALLQLAQCAEDTKEAAQTRYNELPEGFWLFNLFHPFDPHANRLEPLMNPTMGELPMELVPLEGKQVAEKLCRAFDEAFAKEEEGFNHGVRADWSLQGSLSEEEKARPLFFTHTAYLSSAKVAAFIQAAAHEIDLFGKKGSVEGWLEDLAAEEKEDLSLARSPATGSEYSDPLGASPGSSPKDPFSDFRSRSLHSAQAPSSPSREQLLRERREQREQKMAEVRQLKEDYLESVSEASANLKASFQQAFQGVRGALALKPSNGATGSSSRR